VTGADGDGELPAPILRMVETLSTIGRSELVWRLQIDLTPEHDAPAERLAELGALAGILRDEGQFTARLSKHLDLAAMQEEADQRAARRMQARGGSWSPDPARNYQAHSPRRDEPTEGFATVQFPGRRPRGRIRAALPVEEWRTVPPARYDQLRPATAPSAARLTNRYGGWTIACRAADGLLEDGRYLGIGRPWVTRPPAVRPGGFTREEVVDAIRACALHTLTRPSGFRYQRWSEAKRRRAQRLGNPSVQLPTHTTIVRLFDSYAKALTAAKITDEYLDTERLRRAGLAVHELPTSPRVRLSEASASDLAEIRIDPDLVQALLAEGFNDLLLPQAVHLARILCGSLDWLAELTPEPGRPPAASAGTQVEPDAIRRLRTSAQISETELRAVIEMPLGPWKRILTGRDTPTLGLTTALGQALGASVSDILG
jgi:hypothetical protein